MYIQELLKSKSFQYVVGGISMVALTLLVTYTSILPPTKLLQAAAIDVGSSYVSCSGKLDPKTAMGESIKVTWTVEAHSLPDSVYDKMQTETHDLSIKSWKYCIKNTVNGNRSCDGSMKSIPLTVKITSTYPTSDNNTTKTMLPYIQYEYEGDGDYLFPDPDYIRGPTCSLKLTQNPAPAPAAPTYKSQSKVADGTKFDVTVEWNTVSGASSYKIKSSASPAGPWTTVVASTATPKTTIQNLGTGTTYYTATATKYGTESSNSTPVAVNIAAPAPPPPAALTAPTGFYAWPATPNAANPALYDVTLTWWQVLGATGYNIKASQTQGGPFTTVLSPTTSVCKWDDNFQGLVCKVVFTAVQPGTYYDVISATKTGTESPNSTPLKIVVAATPVIAGQVSCSGSQVTPKAGDTKLKINWTANITGVTQADVTSVAWTSISALPSDPAPANGNTTQTAYDPSILDSVQAAAAVATVTANGQTFKSQICSANLTEIPEADQQEAAQTLEDTDEDGVPDNDDLCPNEPANTIDGCPDKAESQSTQEETLKSAVNLMTCKAGGDILNLVTEKPIYVHCGFTQAAIVNAFVVSGDHDPKQPSTEDKKVKVFLTDESQPAETLVITWSGINDYDTTVENGEYSLVVSAVPNKSYAPDYSILKFTVTDEPLPQSTQEETTNTQTNIPESQPTQPTLPPAPVEPPTPPEPSKCPGVNYPIDIKNHWAENFIKTAYDECLLTGYRDGTFRPNQNITRSETTKMVVAAINKPPVVCYDNDCGTPYIDLDTWEGPWVRPAWDLKIINKTGTRFESKRAITRAEASSLIVNGFKFPVPAFCYTANCGAGFPDNFFIDIKQAWQGPYIRSLWDKKVIQGTTPGMFEPNRAITRAEVIKMIISSRVAVKEATPPTPPASPQQ